MLRAMRRRKFDRRKIPYAFELLKRKWRALPEKDRWRLFRSLIVREHLQTTGSPETVWRSPRIGLSSPLLRYRRLEIARHYRSRGFKLHPSVTAYALPKGRRWQNISALCPGEVPR